MAKALAIRPGSTAINAKIPAKNASAAFLEASGRLTQASVAAGLPER